MKENIQTILPVKSFNLGNIKPTFTERGTIIIYNNCYKVRVAELESIMFNTQANY